MKLHVGDYLESKLTAFFYQYAHFVGRKPYVLLLGSVLLSLIALPGFQYFSINGDVNDLFIPWNAIVREELKLLSNFNHMEQNLPFEERESRRLIRQADKNIKKRNLPMVTTTTPPTSTSGKLPNTSTTDLISGSNFYNRLKLYIKAKNGSNILTAPVFDYLQNLTLIFRHTTFNLKGRRISYVGDLCHDPCVDLNSWIYKAKTIFADKKFSRNPNIRLTYPYMRFLETRIPIDEFVYGVEVSTLGKTLISAQVISLNYYIDQQEYPLLKEANDKFVKVFTDFWDRYDGLHGLEIITFQERAINAEMDNIINMAMPFILLTITILTAFVVVTNVGSSGNQCKPVEAFSAVISVLLALVTTFGFLFAIGIRFNVIACVTPYLVLAIGVDDAFLIMAAWRHSNRKYSVPDRLAQTMSECGVSITVTTLTDGLCFIIGYFACLTPAIGEFCLFTAVAISFDYLYQITFFIAVVALGGRREEFDKSLCCCLATIKKIHPIKDSEDVSAVPDLIASRFKSHPELPKPIDDTPLMSILFRHYWGPFINSVPVKIFSVLLFFAYLGISLYGCITIKADMAPQKFVADNSRMLRFFDLAERYIWGDSVKARVVITKPQDYRIAENRFRFLSYVNAMESTPYSVGIESTQVWIRDYLRFFQYYGNFNVDRDFYNVTILRDFFVSNIGKQYIQDVKFFKNATDMTLEPCLSGFVYSTNFFHLHDWNQRERLLFIWRDLMAQYEEMNPAAADFISIYIDQKSAISPSTTQTIGAALIAMAIIAAMFIPNPASIFYVTISLLSISTGTIGGLKLWGADLDHVSLGTILMAIGFAVDFTAHICVKFHRLSRDIRADERVIITMGAVGWPILQAALSTLLGVFVLGFVPAYMVRVFFQCTTLVIAFGVMHALLFLPIFQAALEPDYKRVRRLHRFKIKPKLIRLDEKLSKGPVVIMW